MGNKFDHTRDYNERRDTRAQEEINMYQYCDIVQVVSIDRNGLQGREVEPPRSVEGQFGVVLGTDIEDPDGEMPLVIHTVMMDRTGDLYEFADYELN